MVQDDEDNHNMRLIFRPTTEQYRRIFNIYRSGQYKHISEILRDMANEGLPVIEKRVKKREETTL